MPSGSPKAHLQQLNLIGGAFNLLAVEPHVHGVAKVQAHGGHDDEHPMLLAQFPELQPIDQGLIAADAGDMHDIDRFDLISFDGLDEGREAGTLLPPFVPLIPRSRRSTMI